jgi:eukaryotic-like serine/threonine-protein kinase
MSTLNPQPPATSADLTETVVSTGRNDPSHLDRTQAMPPDTKTGEQPSKPPAASGPKKTPRTYTLGDFELRKELGQGGMGKVFLAQQISLDRPCAVKVMSSELSKRPDFVERFIREARSMARLDHPSIVRCFAVGEERGKHYVAMELIDGRSMQDWLNELGRLDVADAMLITLICADALQFAHAKNMIHRDIKPDNLLVTRDGIVKVADLGLAKATDEDMSMTQSGTGLGTPHYMPPEQARNAKHVDARCDIYALGCTLYHFLTGALPFSGETVLELITAKEKGQFKPASRLTPGVPERLDLIIDKMMARDPKHRYSSCAEVIHDLEQLNLSGEVLSFTASDGAVPIRRRSSPATLDMVAGHQTAPIVPPGRPRSASSQRTSAERSAQRRTTHDQTAQRQSGAHTAAGSSPDWYVRHTDKSGKTKVSKMSTNQVLQGMRSEQLDLKTRVSRDPKNGFVPLAQFPVFEDEANRMVARTQASQRQRDLSDAYKKIEKQYDRQKWWRLLSRFKDGTMGFVGLILWLLLVAAAGALGIYGMIQGWEYLGSWIEKLG